MTNAIVLNCRRELPPEVYVAPCGRAGLFRYSPLRGGKLCGINGENKSVHQWRSSLTLPHMTNAATSIPKHGAPCDVAGAHARGMRKFLTSTACRSPEPQHVVSWRIAGGGPLRIFRQTNNRLPLRRGRACPGHPCTPAPITFMDGRHRAGQDDEWAAAGVSPANSGGSNGNFGEARGRGTRFRKNNL
jgi:hypothetical protein